MPDGRYSKYVYLLSFASRVSMPERYFASSLRWNENRRREHSVRWIFGVLSEILPHSFMKAGILIRFRIDMPV